MNTRIDYYAMSKNLSKNHPYYYRDTYARLINELWLHVEEWKSSDDNEEVEKLRELTRELSIKFNNSEISGALDGDLL